MSLKHLFLLFHTVLPSIMLFFLVFQLIVFYLTLVRASISFDMWSMWYKWIKILILESFFLLMTEGRDVKPMFMSPSNSSFFLHFFLFTSIFLSSIPWESCYISIMGITSSYFIFVVYLLTSVWVKIWLFLNLFTSLLFLE